MIRNTISMLASTILRFINGVLLIVVLARFWGPETFGVFMYPFTLAGLIVILVDYGFNLQLVRDIGRNAQDVHRIVCQALATKTLLSVIVLALGVPIVILLNALEGYRILIILLLLSNIFNSYGLIFNLSFRGVGMFEQEVKTVLVSTLLTALFVGTLILLGQGPTAVAICLVTTKAFFMLYSWMVYKFRVCGTSFTYPDANSILSALCYGFPFAAHVALGSLYLSIDTIIIQYLLGPEKVGIYQAGSRIMLGGMILSDVLGNVYLQKMAKESHDRSMMISLATQMTRHFLIVATLGFICMIGLSELIIKIFYGISGFNQAISLVPLFGVVLLIRYLGVSYGFVLTVSNKQGVRTLGVGLSVLVSVATNLILIPVYGLYGALFASIITHVFLVGIYIIFTYLQTKSLLVDRRTFVLVLIALITGLYQLYAFPVTNIVTYMVMIIAALCIGIAGVTTTEFDYTIKLIRKYAFDAK